VERLKLCCLEAFFVANTFQIQLFHRDWRSRQMWLFVLCQEHNTDIDYQCWLHWHPFHVFATLDKLSHGSGIILGFLPTISRQEKYYCSLILMFIVFLQLNWWWLLLEFA
jgi:hypothetical protein